VGTPGPVPWRVAVALICIHQISYFSCDPVSVFSWHSPASHVVGQPIYCHTWEGFLMSRNSALTTSFLLHASLRILSHSAVSPLWFCRVCTRSGLLGSNPCSSAALVRSSATHADSTLPMVFRSATGLCAWAVSNRICLASLALPSLILSNCQGIYLI